MIHPSSEDDSSPDCEDFNPPLCVFYFSHPYRVGSPCETAKHTVRSTVTKRPGAARPRRGRRVQNLPPRRRNRRPDACWRRFLRRPIHHLKSFLFVREQDLAGPSKAISPLPDLEEVLRIVRQAWTSPRSCSLDRHSSKKQNHQGGSQEMGTGPKGSRVLPHRRYSVPETVMRRYVLTKQRSGGSSDSGVATVPPVTPGSNSTSSRSSVNRMGHSLDSSDSMPGPSNPDGKNKSQSSKRHDLRSLKSESSSSECYDHRSKSLNGTTGVFDVRTSYRSKSMSENSDVKHDSPSKQSTSNKNSNDAIAESPKANTECLVPDSDIRTEDKDSTHNCEKIKNNEENILTIVNGKVNEGLQAEEDDGKNTEFNFNKHYSELLNQTTLPNTSSCKTKAECKHKVMKETDDSVIKHDFVSETCKVFEHNSLCDKSINTDVKERPEASKDSVANTNAENDLLTNIAIRSHQTEERDISGTESNESENTNELTSGISSKYSCTSSETGKTSSKSKSDDSLGYNDSPTSKTSNSIYTTPEICTTTPDRGQATSEMSDNVSESCSITPVGSSSDSSGSLTTPERPDTRLDTSSSTAPTNSSTSTLGQTVSENTTSTQDMTLSIRSDSGVTRSTLSTPGSPDQENNNVGNIDKSTTSCSESTQDLDHIASLEDYVNENYNKNAEIILKAFRDKDKYTEPVREMISQSTQTSSNKLSSRTLCDRFDVNRSLEYSHSPSHKEYVPKTGLDKENVITSNNDSKHLSTELNKNENSKNNACPLKQITTVLPCKPQIAEILNSETVKVQNENIKNAFQSSLWLNRSLQNTKGFRQTKISIKGLSKTDAHIAENKENFSNKVISQTAYNWLHVTDHDRSKQNTNAEQNQNPTNVISDQSCLSSCIGTGSTYRPLPESQLVIPRYSALPRSISMLVNTSSGECSSNSNSDSECPSLVDSLEDSVSPFRMKNFSKLNKTNVDKLFPGDKSVDNIKPKSFFISIGELDIAEVSAQSLSISQSMPNRIKEKLLKRQQAMQMKKLQRQKSEEANTLAKYNNKIAVSKLRNKRIRTEPKKDKTVKNYADLTMVESDIKNLEQYESYIIIDIVDSSVHVQPAKNGCVKQPNITVSIQPEIYSFPIDGIQVDENQNSIIKDIKDESDKFNPLNINESNDTVIQRTSIDQVLKKKISSEIVSVAEKAIQTTENNIDDDEGKENSNKRGKPADLVVNMNETYCETKNTSLNSKPSPVNSELSCGNYENMNTDDELDRLSETGSTTDEEDAVSIKTCKSLTESSKNKTLDNKEAINITVSNKQLASEEAKTEFIENSIIEELNNGNTERLPGVYESNEDNTHKERSKSTEKLTNLNLSLNSITVDKIKKESYKEQNKESVEMPSPTIVNINQEPQEFSEVEYSSSHINNIKHSKGESKSSICSMSQETQSYENVPKKEINNVQEVIDSNTLSPNKEFTKYATYKSHIPIMKSPIGPQKVLKEQACEMNPNETNSHKPSQLPVRKPLSSSSSLQPPHSRRSANLTNKFRQRFEVIPEERSCSLESSNEDQNKFIGNRNDHLCAILTQKDYINNMTQQNVSLARTAESNENSDKVTKVPNRSTLASRKPFTYKPRTEKGNKFDIINDKSISTYKTKTTRSEKVRKENNISQNESNKMLTKRKRNVLEESSSSNGDNNNKSGCSRRLSNSNNDSQRLTRRPVRQCKIDREDTSFQQIEEIVLLRPEPSKCYKGKASLLTQAEEHDLLTLSKGWINFYLLKNNHGTPEDSNHEDDGTDKHQKDFTQRKTVTVVGGEPHRIRQYTVSTRPSNSDNNIEQNTVLPELVRKKSAPIVGKQNTPSPSDSDHSTTYLDIPSPRSRVPNLLDGSGDMACSESSSITSTNDSDCDHNMHSALLPTRWLARQWRGSKPSRQRQRTQHCRTELTQSQCPSHYPGGESGGNSSGWTVTLAGSANCPQPPPHDLEMKLSFPACSRRQPASQSDSGLGEDNNHHQDENPSNLLPLSPSNTPTQQWSFKVKNSQGSAPRSRDEYRNNKMSYECLPDLAYHPGQNKNAKRVIKKRPDTGFPMTSVVADDMRRTTHVWPKAQKVLESKVIICKTSGQVSHQVRSVSHLLEDDQDIIHTQTELEITGSAITPEKKPRVPTMSERDLTRGHTARRKTVNTTMFNYLES